MKDSEELLTKCANLIRILREEKGLSITKISEFVGIDRRTWKKYEDGMSVPSVVDFIVILDALGQDGMCHISELLCAGSDGSCLTESKNLRSCTAYYIQSQAPIQFVRDLDFIISGRHKLNARLSIQGITILKHLPMTYQYAVAKHILSSWEIASLKKEVINEDDIMPHKETFIQGIEKCRSMIIMEQEKNNYDMEIY